MESLDLWGLLKAAVFLLLQVLLRLLLSLLFIMVLTSLSGGRLQFQVFFYGQVIKKRHFSDVEKVKELAAVMTEAGGCDAGGQLLEDVVGLPHQVVTSRFLSQSRQFMATERTLTVR